MHAFDTCALAPDVDQHIVATMLLTSADPQFTADLPDWTRPHLAGCTDGAIKETRIVLSELLANAYQYADPPYSVRLSTSANGNFLRIEVTDSGGGSPPPWHPGKGLLIVRGLCPRSGVHQQTHGKTVWADLMLLVGPSPPRSDLGG